ncbi:metallophosphoesterase [Halorhabdus utahensis DSM 12940]|uniref:Metallophosphoesterase n=2 Tax=Halorhabdus utahensis TaxID=146826 RepID=C7NTA2_HALUD|nr:metallophosphoesterase [Halorhabdus utahensis DSM 12940]
MTDTAGEDIMPQREHEETMGEAHVENHADEDEPVYYVISDLHIGGDEQLEHVEFLDELLSFLKRLEQLDEDAELVINGDAFGLWEFTTLEGIEKFDALVERYPNLFEQLRATGENVQITLLPGNHDHELAAYDAYVERFAAYNVDLVQEQSITRPVGDRTIHFEHGNQRDPNNRFEDFGNPHEKPLGYYYNTLVTSRAGQVSALGRRNWLKDIQAVTPTERVPVWFLSKYFYNEMHPLLRYAIVPFLLVFNLSAIAAIAVGLDLVGVWSMPTETVEGAFGRFGSAGALAFSLLAINVAIVGILVLVWIPIRFILQDFKRTIDRFGLVETEFTVDPSKPYRAAAKDLFEEHPETAVFCYGHTHRPAVDEHDGRLIVNTGTWLKRFHRRQVIAGILPPVFHPTFRLNIVRIAAEDEGVAVEYETMDKPDPAKTDLTFTERLLTVGRVPDPTIPDRVVADDTRAASTSPDE